MDRRTRIGIAIGALLLVGVLVAMLGRGGPAATPSPPPPAPPAGGRHRLVSLSPPITEALIAIGAADQLVGRSAWDQASEAVAALPSAGSALTPDLEAIARLRPTVILTEATAAGPVAELRAVAPTEVLDWLDVDEAAASIRRLGRLTGHVDEADAEADRLTAAFAGTPPSGAPRVLLALGADDVAKGEIWYVKPSSLHGRALEAAGYRNAVTDEAQGAPRLSAEELVRLDPDAVVVLVPGEASAEQRAAIVAAFGELSDLRAVKEHAVTVVAGDRVMDTGPGIVALVGQLREAAGEALAGRR